MKSHCLVVVDVQEKLFPVMYEKHTLLNNLSVLIKGFQLLELPIIITEQVPNKLGKTINDVSSLFNKIDAIDKSTFSCAGEPEFIKRLDQTGADKIILAGIESHVCVYQTALDLLKQRRKVEIIVDCISSRNLNNHNVAVEMMKVKGVSLNTTEMLLFSIQKSASGDTFRKLVKLIR